MYKFALKADKVNCEAKEDALGCENFESVIVKTVEWYLKLYCRVITIA